MTTLFLEDLNSRDSRRFAKQVLEQQAQLSNGKCELRLALEASLSLQAVFQFEDKNERSSASDSLVGTPVSRPSEKYRTPEKSSDGDLSPTHSVGPSHAAGDGISKSLSNLSPLPPPLMTSPPSVQSTLANRTPTKNKLQAVGSAKKTPTKIVSDADVNQILREGCEQAARITVVGSAGSFNRDLQGAPRSAAFLTPNTPPSSSTLNGSKRRMPEAPTSPLTAQRLPPYSTPLDVTYFKSLEVLTLKHCRISAIKGICPCRELNLLHSTILAPLNVDPTTGSTPPSECALPLAATLLSTWDHFSRLVVLRCAECSGPFATISLAALIPVLPALEVLELTSGSAPGDTVEFPVAVASTPYANLTELNLCGNSIKSLHSSWLQLTALKRLILQDNEISATGGAMRRFEALQVVNLRGNLLTDSSDVAASFPNVTSLDVSSNRLESLSGFRGLTHLSSLLVNSNKVAAWPDILALAVCCGSLQSLSFLDNPLCITVFSGDVTKLGHAVIQRAAQLRGENAQHREVKVNGLPLDPSQSYAAVWHRYRQLFEGSGAPGAAALTGISPNRREPSEDKGTQTTLSPTAAVTAVLLPLALGETEMNHDVVMMPKAVPHSPKLLTQSPKLQSRRCDPNTSIGDPMHPMPRDREVKSGSDGVPAAEATAIVPPIPSPWVPPPMMELCTPRDETEEPDRPTHLKGDEFDEFVSAPLDAFLHEFVTHAECEGRQCLEYVAFPLESDAEQRGAVATMRDVWHAGRPSSSCKIPEIWIRDANVKTHYRHLGGRVLLRVDTRTLEGAAAITLKRKDLTPEAAESWTASFPRAFLTSIHHSNRLTTATTDCALTASQGFSTAAGFVCDSNATAERLITFFRAKFDRWRNDKDHLLQRCDWPLFSLMEEEREMIAHVRPPMLVMKTCPGAPCLELSACEWVHQYEHQRQQQQQQDGDESDEVSETAAMMQYFEFAASVKSTWTMLHNQRLGAPWHTTPQAVVRQLEAHLKSIMTASDSTIVECSFVNMCVCSNNKSEASFLLCISNSHLHFLADECSVDVDGSFSPEAHVPAASVALSALNSIVVRWGFQSLHLVVDGSAEAIVIRTGEWRTTATVVAAMLRGTRGNCLLRFDAVPAELALGQLAAADDSISYAECFQASLPFDDNTDDTKQSPQRRLHSASDTDLSRQGSPNKSTLLGKGFTRRCCYPIRHLKSMAPSWRRISVVIQLLMSGETATASIRMRSLDDSSWADTMPIESLDHCVAPSSFHPFPLVVVLGFVTPAPDGCSEAQRRREALCFQQADAVLRFLEDLSTIYFQVMSKPLSVVTRGAETFIK